MANTDPVKICPQEGKHIHRSRNAALSSLKQLRERKDPEYKGEVYRCIYCGGWHFGRQTKNAHKSKY